jgi:hypothetical protein
MRQEMHWVQATNPNHPVLRSCQHLALTGQVHARRRALKFPSFVVAVKFDGTRA